MYIDERTKKKLLIILVILVFGYLVVKTTFFDNITLIKDEWAGLTVGHIKARKLPGSVKAPIISTPPPALPNSIGNSTGLGELLT